MWGPRTRAYRIAVRAISPDGTACHGAARAIIPDAAPAPQRRPARGFVGGDPTPTGKHVADHVTASRDEEFWDRDRRSRAVSGALPECQASEPASRRVCDVSVVPASGRAAAAWNDVRRTTAVLVWRMGCIRSSPFAVPLPVSRTSGHEHRM